MDAEEKRNLEGIHTWFQKVWNERSEAAIDMMMAEDVVGHGLAPEPVDKAGFKAAWRFFLDTFTDFHVVVEDAMVRGDTTSCRVVATAVHTGPGLGIASSGKPVRICAQIFTRWKDGRIVEGWNAVDMADVYRQVGATFS